MHGSSFIKTVYLSIFRMRKKYDFNAIWFEIHLMPHLLFCSGIFIKKVCTRSAYLYVFPDTSSIEFQNGYTFEMFIHKSNMKQININKHSQRKLLLPLSIHCFHFQSIHCPYT